MHFFCHSCKVFQIHPAEADVLQCPLCRSELVEQVESDAQRDELLRSYGLLRANGMQSSTTVFVSQAPFAPPLHPSSSSQHRPPQLLDLLRHEIGMAQHAAHYPFHNGVPLVGHVSFHSGQFGDDQALMRQVMHRVLMQHEPHSQPTPPHVLSTFARRSTGVPPSADVTNEPCAICHESMSMAEGSDDTQVGELSEVLQLPCGHWYHARCIEAWLAMATTCPACRRSVLP